MIIGEVADRVSRGAEATASAVSGAFFEPVIRLGVTGLARAGKTVFITSLITNLLERGRMDGLSAVAQGRIEAAYLQPQPDDTVPRFDYETHLAQMTGTHPSWPDSTRHVSQLRLSLKVRPSGMLGGIRNARTLHLDIVDYPGEWLLDLELLDLDFAAWSTRVLLRAEGRSQAAELVSLVKRTDAQGPFDDNRARALAETYTTYLHDARNAGFSDLTPGRFLLPGELEGSPVLTFAPLAGSRGPRKSLWREMERRFEAYKARVVRPFFRDHFARIDRQIVLIDALGAIHTGPQAVEDMRRAMADILGAFRPGRNGFLARLLRGRRVDRILFAATKADHLHQTQHPAMTAIIDALVQDAKTRAEFAGADVSALALASLRATTEEERSHDSQLLPCVRGQLNDGRQAAFWPGALPQNPAELLAPARDGAEAWLDGEYGAMLFSPAPLSHTPGAGLPHIRLDRAAEFLIGDRL